MISKTLEINILNAIAQAYNGSGGSAISNVVTFPSDGYLALFTTMPTRNTAQGQEGELTGGQEVASQTGTNPTVDTGYARVNLDGTPLGGGHYFASAPTWDNTNKCFVIKNSTAIQFPMATASWGEVVGFGIYTASTGGTLTMAGYLVDGDGYKDSVPVPANNAVAFAAGQLQINLSDSIPADNPVSSGT